MLWHLPESLTLRASDNQAFLSIRVMTPCMAYKPANLALRVKVAGSIGKSVNSKRK